MSAERAGADDDADDDDTRPLLERPFLAFGLTARHTWFTITRAQYDALPPLVRRFADLCGVQSKSD